MGMSRNGLKSVYFSRESVQFKIRYRVRKIGHPLGLIQCKIPMHNKIEANCYTKEGRKLLHINDEKSLFGVLMKSNMRQILYSRSIEYMDNKVLLYYDQSGKCAITGKKFESIDEIHCHHIIPVHCGGNDDKNNLILISDMVHRLIHATKHTTIYKYLEALKLNDSQIEQINLYRQSAKLDKI